MTDPTSNAATSAVLDSSETAVAPRVPTDIADATAGSTHDQDHPDPMDASIQTTSTHINVALSPVLDPWAAAATTIQPDDDKPNGPPSENNTAASFHQASTPSQSDVHPAPSIPSPNDPQNNLPLSTLTSLNDTAAPLPIEKSPDPLVDPRPLPPDAPASTLPTNTSSTTSSIPTSPPSTLPAASSLPQATPSPTNSPSDLPHIDFDLFLSQMRHPTAFMLTRYLKSFLHEFQKKIWSPDQQQKIILDFIEFTHGKMRSCEPWQLAGDAEMEVAREGLEKLVMTKLYKWTFQPIQSSDVAMDKELALKMRYFRWVTVVHLDIPERFRNGLVEGVKFAQQELHMMNKFKAPRDKLICILNCCKLIMGWMQTVTKEAGADDFLPILIYAVLRANPLNLMSNVQFVYRFRNPNKLQSEAGYYLTNMMGAVHFIEKMDISCLTISAEEYDQCMMTAIAAVEEEDEQERQRQVQQQTQTSPPPLPDRSSGSSSTSTPLVGASPSLRFLQKPMQLLTRLFTEPSIDEPISAVSPSAALHLSHQQIVQATQPPASVQVEKHRRSTSAASSSSGFLQSFYTPNAPSVVSTATAAGHVNKALPRSPDASGYPGDVVLGSVAEVEQGEVAVEVGAEDVVEAELNIESEATPARPFERKLSAQERAMLNDYEMQLAMALSLSMNASEEYVVHEEHAEQGVQHPSEFIAQDSNQSLLMDEPVPEQLVIDSPPLLPSPPQEHTDHVVSSVVDVPTAVQVVGDNGGRRGEPESAERSRAE